MIWSKWKIAPSLDVHIFQTRQFYNYRKIKFNLLCHMLDAAGQYTKAWTMCVHSLNAFTFYGHYVLPTLYFTLSNAFMMQLINSTWGCSFWNFFWQILHEKISLLAHLRTMWYQTIENLQQQLNQCSSEINKTSCWELKEGCSTLAKTGYGMT